MNAQVDLSLATVREILMACDSDLVVETPPLSQANAAAARAMLEEGYARGGRRSITSTTRVVASPGVHAL